jgi:hypothetical protein
MTTFDQCFSKAGNTRFKRYGRSGGPTVGISP